MRLSSPAFTHGGSIPSEYTCDGKNAHPELYISGVPTQAKTLVLIMDDPDVPESVRTDKMWVHWVLFNIPPEVRHIPKGSQPAGVPGKNTGGTLSYQGPCPPDREHRYFFKLYALDALLALPQGSTKADIEHAMQGHILAQTELIGRYDRTRTPEAEAKEEEE